MRSDWFSMHSSPIDKVIMRSHPHSSAEFKLCLLENGNYMTSGLVYDGLVQFEFDTVEAAYAQYRDWVLPEELYTIERYKP